MSLSFNSILKTRGFCLESTHLNDSERLSKLVALLALALCWAHQVGHWLTEQKPILIKQHGRKAKSLFRTGFDYLRRIVLNLESNADAFFSVLQFLPLYIECEASSTEHPKDRPYFG